MKEHRKLAAIMFTDIAGYSALMSKDEKLAMSILEKNRNIHKTIIAKFSGEYIKEIGDGTLAIFQSSLDAVNCAIKIMKSCIKESSYSLRIGIHIGDIVFRDSDVFGDGVNIASRIEAGGKPGGIYISERVYEDIKNKHEIKSGFVEERMLKNIDFPVKIYFIDAKGSSLSKFPVRKTDQLKPADIKKTFLSRRNLITIAGIAVVLSILVVLILLLLPNQRNDDLPQRIVVAVFENRTGDPTLDELGKMTADWITQGLSQTKEADVVPNTTVMQILGLMQATSDGKQQSNYLSKLARETKADVIVSGTYYLQHNTLQFRAEVKNVTDGSLIYALPIITGSLEKPMEVIEKVSSEITGGLAYHFRLQDIRIISKPPSKDAYSEYLTGLELFGLDYEGAMQHFVRATKIDSLFMPPQFYIVSIFAFLGEYSQADSVVQIIRRNRERLTPFERHMLDNTIAELNGNYAECLRHLRLAENISPGDWTVNFVIGLHAVHLNKPKITVETYAKLDIPYSYYGNLGVGPWRIGILTEALHLLGEYNQELVQSRMGQQYYPDWIWFYTDEVRALAALGRVEEITKVIDKCNTISSRSGTMGDVITEVALELRAHGNVYVAHEYAGEAVKWYQNQPASMDIREDLADALYVAENWQEAQTLFEQLAAEYPENIDYLGYLGTLAARRGDREEAVKISEKLRCIDRPYLFGQHTYWRARIAAILGEHEQVVKLLGESFAQGKRFSVTIHSTIDFESLKDYPPYKELLKPIE
jgi:class 3 adenylate cyclase/tetratricopeptide (TPR) repeat protein